MAITAEEVVTRLKLDAQQFKQGLREAANDASSSMSDVERSASRAEAGMRKLAPAATSAGGALRETLAQGIGQVTTSSVAGEIAIAALSGVITGGLAGAVASAIPLAIEFGAQLLTSGKAGEDAAAGYDAAGAAANRYAAALKHLRDPGGTDLGVVLDKMARREIEIRTLEGRIPTMAGTRGPDAQARSAANARLEQLKAENVRDQGLVEVAQAREAAKARAQQREQDQRDEEAADRRAEQSRDQAARRAAMAVRERNRQVLQAEREAERERAEVIDNYNTGIAKFIAAGDRAGKEGIREFDREGEVGLRDFRRDQADRQELVLKDAEALHARQADNVRSLAGLYETAFTQGAKGIGDALRQELTRAIAESLARLTINKLSSLSSAGGILGAIGKLAGGVSGTSISPISTGGSIAPAFDFSSIPGRASGGYVGAGQLYRVNEASGAGNPEFFRPQGSGTVIPLGQTKALAGGGTMIVHQHFNLDARYGITSTELIQYVNTTAAQAATRGAAGGAAMAQANSARRDRYRLG